MATRPVFLPVCNGDKLVEERNFDFTWAPGFAEVQKKKNVKALHEQAMQSGIVSVLEISTKSETAVGKRLSAFSLKIELNGEFHPLESVYQGSKVFEKGGPFPEIFHLQPRDAKRFIRDEDRGKLRCFKLEGETYPLSPKNAFYDWLYIKALAKHVSWIVSNVDYEGFTDIEFNPAKQVNCQARAFAEFLSLAHRDQLTTAVSDFKYFAEWLPVI